MNGLSVRRSRQRHIPCPNPNYRKWCRRDLHDLSLLVTGQRRLTTAVTHSTDAADHHAFPLVEDRPRLRAEDERNVRRRSHRCLGDRLPLPRCPHRGGNRQHFGRCQAVASVVAGCVHGRRRLVVRRAAARGLCFREGVAAALGDAFNGGAGHDLCAPARCHPAGVLVTRAERLSFGFRLASVVGFPPSALMEASRTSEDMVPVARASYARSTSVNVARRSVRREGSPSPSGDAHSQLISTGAKRARWFVLRFFSRRVDLVGADIPTVIRAPFDQKTDPNGCCGSA